MSKNFRSSAFESDRMVAPFGGAAPLAELVGEVWNGTPEQYGELVAVAAEAIRAADPAATIVANVGVVQRGRDVRRLGRWIAPVVAVLVVAEEVAVAQVVVVDLVLVVAPPVAIVQ